MTGGYQALTEKEKETLRLLVDGYDAKSMARFPGLSVHTINERLRDARRKLAVSSSREAARMLREVEGPTPELLRDKRLGDASDDASMRQLPPQTAAIAAETAAVASARQFLALVDASDWNASWEATGSAFRSLNTTARWAEASKQVRTPLGPMLTRELVTIDFAPAPPHGYWVVKFRTSFANKADAIETLSLVSEDGSWKVVGITID